MTLMDRGPEHDEVFEAAVAIYEYMDLDRDCDGGDVSMANRLAPIMVTYRSRREREPDPSILPKRRSR